MSKWPYLAKQTLGIQIFKSAISVPSNISEGMNRSLNNQNKFFEIAYGSANEAITQLRIAQACGFIKVASAHRYRDNYKRIIDFIKVQFARIQYESGIEDDQEAEDLAF